MEVQTGVDVRRRRGFPHENKQLDGSSTARTGNQPVRSSHLSFPVRESFLEIMTVQAPHPPSPHPSFVPVNLRTSLKKDNRVWFGLAFEARSSGTRFPFTKRIGRVRYPERKYPIVNQHGQNESEGNDGKRAGGRAVPHTHLSVRTSPPVRRLRSRRVNEPWFDPAAWFLLLVARTPRTTTTTWFTVPRLSPLRMLNGKDHLRVRRCPQPYSLSHSYQRRKGENWKGSFSFDAVVDTGRSDGQKYSY